MNRRWLGIAVFVVAAGVAAIVLFESTAPAPELPRRLRLPDAVVVAIAPPKSGFTTSGAPFPAAVVTPTLGQACVTGNVIDALNGLAVAGADITLSTFAGQRKTTTDSTGRFELRGLTEGTVHLSLVRADGYLELTPSAELHLIDGVCVSSLTLTLSPRVEYVGDVVDAEGAPIVGAHVTITTEREAELQSFVTDARGRFHFIAPEEALITVTHPGFLTRRAEIDFKVRTTRALTVRLEKLSDDGGSSTTEIRGVVLDERDAGVEAVVIIRREFGFTRAVERTLQTSAAGAFTFTAERGSFFLIARHGDDGSAWVRSAGGEVVLRVQREATLQGLVRDEQGAPVPMFSVLLQAKQGALELNAVEPRHVVDADGAFHVSGVTPGAYELVIAAPGFAPSNPQVLELPPGEIRSVEVRLGRGVQVQGSIVSRSTRAPLRGARVSLERSVDDTALPLARTDENGRFSLGGLTPGRRSLLAEAEGHDSRLLSLEVSASGATGLVIDLAPVPDGGTPELELVGIGAVLKADADLLLIDGLIPGGGAERAGLRTSERLVSIDGANVVMLGFGGSIERLRGAEDTTVVVEVRDASGLTRRVVVTRRRVAR
ncbi:MAG: carboxypeptidase regulatory-like domain-containing protein [Myxococcaceae bacterium]